MLKALLEPFSNSYRENEWILFLEFLRQFVQLDCRVVLCMGSRDVVLEGLLGRKHRVAERGIDVRTHPTRWLRR